MEKGMKQTNQRKGRNPWLVWMGVFAMVFVLAACGPVGPGEGASEEAPEDMPEYRVAALMEDWLNVEENPLHLSFSTEFENDLLTAQLYVKNGMIRMDSQDPEAGMVSVITNSQGSFVVLQDHGMYMKSDGEQDELDTENMSFFLTEDELEQFTITTGQETIKSITYDFEKLTMEGEELTYYFLPENGQWSALKSEDTMMFIHGISSEVSDELFEIPADFLDMTGQM